MVNTVFGVDIPMKQIVNDAFVDCITRSVDQTAERLIQGYGRENIDRIMGEILIAAFLSPLPVYKSAASALDDAVKAMIS
jgi:hypothetical protein